MINAIRNYFLECEFLAPGAMLGIDYLGNLKISYSINVEPTNPTIRRYADGGALKAVNFSFSSREYYSSHAQENTDNIKFYEDLEAWIKSNNKSGVVPILDGKTAQYVEVLTSGYMMDATSEDAQYVIQLRLIYEEEY